jgi:hypothetical protein
MKGTINRQDITYRLYNLNNLPELESYTFQFESQVAYTGSIIKRSLNKGNGPLKHFGLVYGFDLQGTLWIIENNENGVELVTIRDFLAGCPTYEVVELNSEKKNVGGILSRVAERAHLPYHVRDNNCEQFAFFGLNGEHKSEQVKVAELIANKSLSLLELYISMSSRHLGPEWAADWNGLRETVRLPRSQEDNDRLNKVMGVAHRQA